MLTRDSRIPPAQLIEAARSRAAETNLRSTADEIGIEHSTLNKLLHGGRTPRSSTVQKLTEWYLKAAAAGQLGLSADVVEAALAIIVNHLPPERRENAIGELREHARELTARYRTALPAWLARSI
jgi:hypothetical protein